MRSKARTFAEKLADTGRIDRQDLSAIRRQTLGPSRKRKEKRPARDNDAALIAGAGVRPRLDRPSPPLSRRGDGGTVDQREPPAGTSRENYQEPGANYISEGYRDPKSWRPLVPAKDAILWAADKLRKKQDIGR